MAIIASDSFKFVSDYISPINTLIFTSTILVDLCAPKIPVPKILIVLIAVSLLVLLCRIRSIYKNKTAANYRSLMSPLIRDKGIWAGTVLLIFTAGTLISNMSYAQGKGVLAETIPSIASLQASLFSINTKLDNVSSDLKDIKRALSPEDIRGQLKIMGYGLNESSVETAIAGANFDAIQLYIAAQKEHSFYFPENLDVIPLMKYHDPIILKLIQILAGQGEDFNQLYFNKWFSIDNPSKFQSMLKATLPHSKYSVFMIRMYRLHR